MDVEKEVQARVEFKMKELLTGIRNTAINNWNSAMIGSSMKHSYYWEAFNKMEQMFMKELSMATPYDQMFEQKRMEKRDIAIEKIGQLFNRRGERDYHYKERILAGIIKEAQDL